MVVQRPTAFLANCAPDIQQPAWSSYVSGLKGRQRSKKRTQPAHIRMYDATSLRSFKDVVFWHNEILRGSPNAMVALVGTKCDLLDEQRLSEEDGKTQAAEWDALHFRSSSKDGDTVERVLKGLIMKII